MFLWMQERSWLVGIGTEEYRTGIGRKYRTGNRRGDQMTNAALSACTCTMYTELWYTNHYTGLT